MDHWGDPWADADDKSPTTTKQEVASPPPTLAPAPAPIVLNGFLDDAGWGNHEDEGFGAWASSPRKPEPADAVLETRVDGVKSTTAWDEVTDVRQDDFAPKDRAEMLPESNEWSRFDEDARETDNVVSETSDSATTIQLDDAPGRTATDLIDSLHPDDDLSTRPSTSPSDVSHNEAATESPRTSFEDERAAGKTPGIEEDSTHDAEKSTVDVFEKIEQQPEPTGRTDVDDDFGDFEEDVVQDAAESQLNVELIERPLESPGWRAEEHKTSRIEDSGPTSHRTVIPNVGAHTLDSDLLAQLFPPTKDIQSLAEAPDDPVHSTSTRKAWYRLTRKQTMREFDNGNDDDNYIRVTWKTSHIRSDVNKIVARWASEDRIAGRGPGARASFYWDTAPSSAPKAPLHPRKQSSISVSNPIRPARQSVQQLSTDVPAAFNWSSPSTAHGPVQQDATGARSVSSPLAPKHSAVAKLQRQEGRAVSLDLTSRPKEQATHKRTATATEVFNENPIAAPLSPLKASQPQESGIIDPWASLGALDTSPPPKEETTTADDDDDWGEMVESPVVSTVQTPIAEISEPSTRNNTLSTPSTTPKSVKSSPLQPFPMSTGSKHASPIVRLKGTVSPTSAIFKPNAFVPASVEQGPIGPGLLKSRDRSADSTPEKKQSQIEPIAQLDEVLETAPARSDTPELDPPSTSAEDDFSAFETSVPQPEPPTSSPLHQEPPPSWAAEPDFSIFESSISTSTPPPPAATTDPSDPWSIFETPIPEPELEPAPAPTPFTRPSQRPATPPTKQPLTSATNSAQKRKAEEDETVRSIIDGLPDLSYMLRR